MKDDVPTIDCKSRCAILTLAASAVLWLAVAGVLALIGSIQLHTPGFLAYCPIFTYGRLSALAETALVYGWIANAGLALILWILARLSGGPLWGARWAAVAALFWNVGVLVSLGGVATGDRTGFPLLEVPAAAQLILWFSYGIFAATGIRTWVARTRRTTFASQWYAVAALVLFPWLLSVVNLTLFKVPARGILQPVTAAWYAQSAWTLWLSPLALSAAYYLVPKITGRVIRGYEFASLGFWTLIVVGPWTAGRMLQGGPVPAWLPATGTVASVLLLGHAVIVAANLGGSLFAAGIPARFTGFGIAAYVTALGAGALLSFQAVGVSTHFTLLETALGDLGLVGAFSLILLGGLYHALPEILGRPWSMPAFSRAHLVLAVAGVVLLVACLAAAGLVQAGALQDPAVGFGVISERIRPWLLGATAARALLLFGNVLLLVNFLITVIGACGCCCRSESCRPAAGAEVSAS